MTQKSSIVNDVTSVEPIILRESDAVAFEIFIAGVVSTLASPTNKFFKRGSNTDLSSTYMTGSASVSGIDTIITKTFQNLKAGDWTLSVGATVDGLVQVVATIPITVKRDGDL